MKSKQNLLIFLSLFHIPWSQGAPSPLEELNINMNLKGTKDMPEIPLEYEEDIHELKSNDDDEISSDSNDYQLLSATPPYQYNKLGGRNGYLSKHYTLGNKMPTPGLNRIQSVFGAVVNGYNSGQQRPFGQFNPYEKLNGYNRYNLRQIGTLGNGYNYGQQSIGGISNRQNRGIIGTLGDKDKQSIYGGIGNRQNRGIIGTLGEKDKQIIYGRIGNRGNRGIIGTLGEKEKQSIYGGIGNRQNRGIIGRLGSGYGKQGNYYNPNDHIAYPHLESGPVKHVDGKLNNDEADFNDEKNMDDIDYKIEGQGGVDEEDKVNKHGN